MKSLFSYNKYGVAFIIFLFLVSVFVNLPKIEINKTFFNKYKINYIGGYSLSFNNFSRDLSLKKGLDISGGVRVTLEPDFSKIKEEDKPKALESLQGIIENRINRFGVNEPSVSVVKFNNVYKIYAEIPGITEVERASELIGTTAKLAFKIEDGEITQKTDTGEEFKIPDFKETELKSTDIKTSNVEIFSGEGADAGQPSVRLIFTAEGAKKFSKLTKENIGKRLAIYLDEYILIAPVINTQIPTGDAYITGGFDVQGAKDLSIQINSGALPVPVKLTSREFVGPSIGVETVNKSIYGGLVGILVVSLFMILNYKKLGLFAVISLIFYGLIILTVYKVVPITLTLPGIAGFILSIGMAVDSNILIFESIKEQLRKGNSASVALENGFSSAWGAIKDSNIVSLIIAFILFNPFDWGFLLNSGPIRGFAVTLAIGILTSLLTGVFISKTLLEIFYRKDTTK